MFDYILNLYKKWWVGSVMEWNELFVHSVVERLAEIRRVWKDLDLSFHNLGNCKET